MPGEPGRAPLPTAVEVWPSVAPFGEAGRISVSIIVLAFVCSSAGSTFAGPGVILNEPDSSATPAVASVTPNLLLLEIRRAFAAYSLPSRSPSSLGRRACSLACRPRSAVVPPACDAAPTTAKTLPHARLHDLRHDATTLLLAGFRFTLLPPGSGTPILP